MCCDGLAPARHEGERRQQRKLHTLAGRSIDGFIDDLQPPAMTLVEAARL